MECTIDELRAVFFSRDLADGEHGACGLGAMIPMAAMRLAQELHAPNLMMILEGGVNPRPPHLVEVPVDPLAHHNIEYASDLFDMYVHAERGLDFWFMTGIQTDRYGNVNLHAVGDPEHPALRGPGVGNASYAATCRRWYNYPGRHSQRTFVENVDFVTGLGNDPDRRRADDRAGMNYGEGCRYVVTPLGVLDFSALGHMRLRHLHPGISLESVREQTGFELEVPDHVTETPLPTDEELQILRRVIDTSGLLRS